MIIIVAGMHRSGTSALAGLLHANGISMGREGDFYPPPMRENPKGFYENVRFRRQNDSMLAANNYRVKSWAPMPPETISVGQERTVAIIELFEDYYTTTDNWGWKDPRTSLTMRVWLDVITSYGLRSEVRVLQCYRVPEAVAASMCKRGNKEKHTGQFVAVARAYRTLLHKHVVAAGYLAQLMKVDFTALINDTAKTVSCISAHIGLPLPDISHIDPLLERTTKYAQQRNNQEAEGDRVQSTRPVQLHQCGYAV